jgi:hypothetical protein
VQRYDNFSSYSSFFFHLVLQDRRQLLECSKGVGWVVVAVVVIITGRRTHNFTFSFPFSLSAGREGRRRKSL